MRKIKLFIASSLDGFIADKKGEIDWLFTDADYGYKKFFSSVDTVLMGSKTYRQSQQFEKEPFKGKKIVVFTRKKPVQEKTGAVFVSNPVAFTKKLLKEKGKDIWLVGGGKIVSLLINAKLIDEIQLFVHPLLLGKGIPLFDKIHERTRFKTVKAKQYKSGLIELHYKTGK